MAEELKQYISKIRLPGTSSDLYLKDTEAREDIAGLKEAVAGGVHFIGVTTTALSDKSTTNPVVVNGESVTAKDGDIVITVASNTESNREYIWHATHWDELGAGALLKALAYKDSASATINVVTGVSSQSFTGAEADLSLDYTPSGTVEIDYSKASASYIYDINFGTVSYTSQTISGGSVSYDASKNSTRKASVDYTGASFGLTAGEVNFGTVNYTSQAIETAGSVNYGSTNSTKKASVSYTAPSFTLTAGSVTHTGASYTKQSVSDWADGSVEVTLPVLSYTRPTLTDGSVNFGTVNYTSQSFSNAGSVNYTSQTVSANEAIKATISNETLVFEAAGLTLTAGGAAYTAPTLTVGGVTHTGGSYTAPTISGGNVAYGATDSTKKATVSYVAPSFALTDGAVNFGTVSYTSQQVSNFTSGNVEVTLPVLSYVDPVLSAGSVTHTGASYTSQEVQNYAAGSVEVTMPSLVYTRPTLSEGAVTHTGASFLSSTINYVDEVTDAATFTGTAGKATGKYTPSGEIAVTLSTGDKEIVVS